MTSRLCVHCKIEPTRGANDLLCKFCRAEKLLAGEDLSVKALDTLATGIFARAVKCDRCGQVEVYSPEQKKTSFFCDECGRQLCRNCAASCSHKDFTTGPKILCTDCRAEKSLTGQPVEETIQDLPGSEKKREPKPHCGRATCIGEFCGCECRKCREAVASGFMDPMFGKMTPDPEPEPEPKEKRKRKSKIEREEEEIARAEGGQP